jgi:hypothetical protein
MFHDPALESSGVASYQWGSFLLETTALFPTDGKSIAQIFSGPASGAWPFESGSEMRRALAVTHELVHLKQDLATGLGAHDHLVTREASLRLLAGTQWLITEYDDPPYRLAALSMLDNLGESPFTDRMRRDLAVLEQETVGLQQLRGASWITPQAHEALQDALGGSAPAGVLEMHSLRRILEGEAACLTWRHVDGADTSEVGAELLRDLRHLWQPGLMGEEYYTALAAVVTAIDSEMDNAALLEGFATYAVLTECIANIATAYPPPGILSEWNHSCHLFDPVVRFILSLRALVIMTPSDFQELLESLENFSRFEEKIGQFIPVPYPASRDVYTEWMNELEPLASASGWDAPLFKMRSDMIRTRLENEQLGALASVFHSQTPIQVLVENVGLRGILWAQHFSDDKLMSAIMAWNMDRQLLDLFYGSGRYRCPYGRAAVCSARKPQCSSGYGRVTQLPPSEGCRVRQSLEDLGYAI